MTADVRCDHRDAASVTNLRSPPAVGSSATVELHASNACCCIGQRGGDGDDFAVHPIAAVMTGVLMAAAVRSGAGRRQCRGSRLPLLPKINL